MSKIISESTVLGTKRCPECATTFEYTPDDLAETYQRFDDENIGWIIYKYWAICPKCQALIFVDEKDEEDRLIYTNILHIDESLYKSSFWNRLLGNSEINYENVKKALIERQENIAQKQETV